MTSNQDKFVCKFKKCCQIKMADGNHCENESFINLDLRSQKSLGPYKIPYTADCCNICKNHLKLLVYAGFLNYSASVLKVLLDQISKPFYIESLDKFENDIIKLKETEQTGEKIVKAINKFINLIPGIRTK